MIVEVKNNLIVLSDTKLEIYATLTPIEAKELANQLMAKSRIVQGQIGGIDVTKEQAVRV